MALSHLLHYPISPFSRQTYTIILRIFTMSFFEVKITEKNISNGKRRPRQPRPRLRYGRAIWICHIALPYGLAKRPCHMALPYDKTEAKRLKTSRVWARQPPIQIPDDYFILKRGALYQKTRGRTNEKLPFVYITYIYIYFKMSLCFYMSICILNRCIFFLYVSYIYIYMCVYIYIYIYPSELLDSPSFPFWP